MFVRLTRNEDGKPVYVRAEHVLAVTGEKDRTYVLVGELAYVVKESAETVVMMLDAAMTLDAATRGGFTA